MKPHRLEETNLAEVRRQPPVKVAVLPLGATEPHNLHLPYGTDTYQVRALAELACRKARQEGAAVIELPTIPYGTESNLMRFPLAMNLQPSTLGRVVTDLVDSLAVHGVPHCLLLNGHGGNDLKWLLRELAGRTSVNLFLCHWWKAGLDEFKQRLDDPGDHAGALETSMGLAHFPELVFLDQADDGAMAQTRFTAINQGWVEITRPWHLLTTNSGAGNPCGASAEAGWAVTERVASRVADFLIQLASEPVDERFPY